MKHAFLPIVIVCIAAIFYSADGRNGLTDPYAVENVINNASTAMPTDTLPPIEDRTGNFIFDQKNNPFDLDDPAVIEQNVEYDPITNRYVLTEKIGDDYFRPPTYMTFDEYLEYRRKEDERAYFRKLAGIGTEGDGVGGLDPLAKIDVDKSLLDRLFGGSTVDIRPQGSIDLTFGVDATRVENPILTERQRRQGGFDFDMNIQMNVTGKIGEKLNLTTNYNTNATFDFDNQIKLDYNSDLFDDDAILKKIEAGNVSLPLRGNLIQGAQSLFGVKTELQFGHLRLTGIISQQKSQQENLKLEGGSQLTEFEVKADEYDENRHFFLTFYNRNNFESGLSNLPQVRSLFKVENLEVWITNNRNEVDNVRDIVAFADLGETDPNNLVGPDKVNIPGTPVNPDIAGGSLPDNTSNDLYGRLLANEEIREIDRSVAILQGPDFRMQQASDFEKVSARKLRPQEYTFHPELGFISLNVNVQPDQVVAVAFTYSYNGETYKVGELSYNQENASADSSLNVLYVKMLKSTTQRTDVPTWDLMMKNIYSIGAFNVNRQDFKLDILYEDPGEGEKRFLPEGEIMGRPLLRVFNLDNLNVQGDPVPDGIFDYVPGITINPRNGRVMFPVLEPFGTDLAEQIPEPDLQEKYVYQELYDQTLFQAQEFPEKNRFTIRGSFKSDVASEISLGSFNIPRGSVTVRAGGQILKEGVDYDIDYNTGRLKIINDAILNSGVPVNVSFEDNQLFGLQAKTMLGLRAEYEIDDDFSVGATYLQLFERPFTQKVNIGEDPINNRIYGVDLSLNREAPWLTKAVNFLPFFNTKAPSSISVTGEAAFLKPGHSRAINQNREDKAGVVLLDDFEGSVNGIDITQPANGWFLASVPQNDNENNNPLFPEAELINDTRSGVNRALLNWYRIDPSVRSSDDSNPYVSRVEQTEVFPNANIPANQQNIFRTFDLSFYPQERGPYNFDIPGGHSGLSRGVEFIGDSVILNDPETRWGGIMRALNNNDFQTANIEFLEFWMLSPFLDRQNTNNPNPDAEDLEGTIYVNLGNISEDILRDSRKFFENGLPGPANPDRRVDSTNWSVVPIGQQITNAFDNDPESRLVQDVGYDGLTNEGEQIQFRDFINTISQSNPVAAARLNEDPANDDYRYYRDASFGNTTSVLDRYRFFNNPHGNSRANDGTGVVSSATNIPDAEDLNRDNTLNETESYFEYQIPLRSNPASPREIDQRITPFITDQRVDESTGRIWYRFRIPLQGNQKRSIGGIRDFRSIRFIRVYLKGFRKPVTLRFARMELVRSQWRRFTRELSDNPIECDVIPPELNVDAVNIEENSDRQPFNYVLPLGIQREQSLGVFNALQNEQSISMRIQQLCNGQDEAIFKNLNLDWRVYERLKMFVHAEEVGGQEIEDGELKLFLRVGSDFINNYYEYEIPLTMSDTTRLPPGDNAGNTDEYKQEVWLAENEIDFPLSLLIDLKQQRNAEGAALGEEFSQLVDELAGEASAKVSIRGNPNLGLVKSVMIGVRNPNGGDGTPKDVEVWLNELRLTGLDERGGMAAVGRVDMQLADLGSITMAGNFSSIGFGALDQKVQERNREEISGYDLAVNLELGKFLPSNWGIRLPFYAQYSKQIQSPEFDPYDLDVTLRDKVDAAATPAARDSIQEIAQEVNTVQSINFTNVRKERTRSGGPQGGQAKPAPWDVENFSLNYAYTKTEQRAPIIEFDREERRTYGLEYGYNRQANYVEPLKFLGDSKALELFSSFNFNPLPNSFTFNTTLDRRLNTTRYRFTGLDDRFNTFFNKSYRWDRDYSLQWDLAKSLKFTYNASNNAVIDEPDEARIRENPDIEDPVAYRKDSIWQNIKRFGRTKNFQHNFNISYTVPIQYIPFMDWIQVKAQYQGSYNWAAAALNVDSLGNVIQNSQDRQINADFNFDALYNKIPYLKKINGSGGGSRRPRLGGQRPGRGDSDEEGEEEKKKREGPSIFEKILIRPLMSLRRARFNYSETFSTTVPGYLPQSRLLGMAPGFGAPGLDFITGFQPTIRTLAESQYNTSEDWLFQTSQKGWLSSSVFVNQEVIQQYNQRWDGRATLEPFPDFRVDVEISRDFTENHSEFYKDIDQTDGINEWVHTVPRKSGSMTISFSALSTLFDDDREQLIGLFRTFEENRVIVSRRLGDLNEPHDDENLAAQGYTKNYGRTQQDVLIPAFLAAYTGEDPNTVNLNIFDTSPRINWRLTYNGLTKLPLFKEIFQNLSISHSYRSTLTVNSFDTGLDFLRTQNDPGGPINELNQNFYPRLEIPQVDIQEGFSPLAQVDAALKNGMSFNMTYNKTRRLGMSFISNQLSETQTTEISVGFGYLIRNFGLFSSGDDGRGNDQQNQPGGNQRNPRLGGGRRGGGQAQDLDIRFNLSLRDDVTFNHLLDQGIVEPTRGTYALSISPSAEYKINQQLSLRLFFDYRRNVPKTSAGFPRTDTAGGVILRFQLQ